MKEFRLRLPKHLHKTLKLEAECCEQSLNDRILTILARSINDTHLVLMYESSQERLLRRIETILNKMLEEK